jgi:hypothetical protein
MRSTISSLLTISLPDGGAALGADLVFDMHGGGAELDQRLDGARDVEGRGAEAGVDIDQQRQVAHVGDAAHVGQHVIQIGDAQVRQANRHTATGQVDRLEAGALGQQGVVGVDGADHLQRGFFLDGFAERGACGVETHVVTFRYCVEVALSSARAMPERQAI